VTGKLKAKELVSSGSTKDYLHVKKVEETNDGIVVEVFISGSYSGKPRRERIKVTYEEMERESKEDKTPETSLLLSELPKEISSQLESFIGQFSPEFKDVIAKGMGKLIGEELGKVKMEFIKRFEGMIYYLNYMISQDHPGKAYFESMRDNLSRYIIKLLGGKTKGEEIIESRYYEDLQKLKKKYPKLDEWGLYIIAEVYPDELIKKTFELLEIINDEKVVAEAIHILSEMAMMKNSPSLYLKLLEVLLNVDNNDIRAKVLNDNRIEYKEDIVIRHIIDEYYNKYCKK
jgi:hypothetical protein